MHVASWGFLGDTWPYFRPHFQNMEAYREEQGVDEVRLLHMYRFFCRPLLTLVSPLSST